jgi:hypothetical protein
LRFGLPIAALALPAHNPVAEMEDKADITTLLGRMRSGDHAAEVELFARVHGELAGRAAQLLRGQRHLTLETLALVNESYLRLVRGAVDWATWILSVRVVLLFHVEPARPPASVTGAAGGSVRVRELRPSGLGATGHPA